MTGPYAEIHAALAPAGCVQMLARIGYGPEAPATPRWPAASRTRESC